MSEINVFEVAYGVFNSKNKKEFERFMSFLENVNIIPAVTFFALDAARIGAVLKKKGVTIYPEDLLIAGMMLNFGISKIVTRNKKHFEAIKELKVISY